MPAFAPDAPQASAIALSGRLLRSPYRGELYRAEMLVMPMARADEYAGAQEFERPSSMPVLLPPSQRNRFLVSLMEETRTLLGGIGLFVISNGGPDVSSPLPRELLAEDVFLTHAPFDLVPWLLEARCRNFAIVRHGLRSDAMDRGINEVEMWLCELDASRRERVPALMRESRTLSYLDELRRRDLDGAALYAQARSLPCTIS